MPEAYNLIRLPELVILIFCEMEGAGRKGPCDDSLLTFVDLFTSSTVY